MYFKTPKYAYVEGLIIRKHGSPIETEGLYAAENIPSRNWLRWLLKMIEANKTQLYIKSFELTPAELGGSDHLGAKLTFDVDGKAPILISVTQLLDETVVGVPETQTEYNYSQAWEHIQTRLHINNFPN